MGYEKAYYRLFNRMTDAIGGLQQIMISLQATQLEVEEMIVDDSNIPTEDED